MIYFILYSNSNSSSVLDSVSHNWKRNQPNRDPIDTPLVTRCSIELSKHSEQITISAAQATNRIAAVRNVRTGSPSSTSVGPSGLGVPMTTACETLALALTSDLPAGSTWFRLGDFSEGPLYCICRCGFSVGTEDSMHKLKVG